MLDISTVLFDSNKQIVFSEIEESFARLLKEELNSSEKEMLLTYKEQLYHVERITQNNNTLFKLRNTTDTQEKKDKMYKMFSAAFEQSYDGVIITDEKGYVIYMNENYLNFLAFDKEKTLGKHVSEVLDGTRMHIVSQTGKAEVNIPWRYKGQLIIVSRFPLFDGEKKLGTIGLILFRKSLELRELLSKIQSIQKKLEYYEDNINSQHQARYDFEDMITVSDNMRSIIEKARKIASTNSNIILSGESGTGKELMAHAVHNNSFRREGPFVKLNCSAIPKDLFESELFGYEDGAFTGAKKGGRIGKFEQAHNGTIFLDEIGEMPLNLQVKLLRVIQERELDKLGSSRPIYVDVRIIAATNQNLAQLVEKGEFRHDLYYRLNVYQIKLPPLRERKADIGLLSRHFIKSISKQMNLRKISVCKEAIQFLENYSWPGNIRELRNLIEMVIGIMDGTTITPEILPATLINETYNMDYYKAPIEEKEELTLNLDYKKSISNLERQLILKALKKAGGQKKKAAEILGIARSLLYKKIKELEIQEIQSYQ